MPYDRRHIVVQWGGTLPGGEIWSNSLRMGSSGLGDGAPVPTHGDLETWCHGSAKDAVAAYHGSTTAQIHTAAKLAYLKMNVVGLDGRYVDPNTIEHVYSPVVSGGGATVLYPNQVTLVISLTTDVSRGYAHRGRYYMPLPVFPVVEADGMISAVAAGFAAGAAGAFIQALANEPGLDLGVFDQRVLVMSKANQGSTHVVTGIDVGRVLDTQRRRRADLPESYVHLAVDQDD